MMRSMQLERPPAVTSTMLQRETGPEMNFVARAMITSSVKMPVRAMK